MQIQTVEKMLQEYNNVRFKKGECFSDVLAEYILLHCHAALGKMVDLQIKSGVKFDKKSIELLYTLEDIK